MGTFVGLLRPLLSEVSSYSKVIGGIDTVADRKSLPIGNRLQSRSQGRRWGEYQLRGLLETQIDFAVSKEGWCDHQSGIRMAVTIAVATSAAVLVVTNGTSNDAGIRRIEQVVVVEFEGTKRHQSVGQGKRRGIGNLWHQGCRHDERLAKGERSSRADAWGRPINTKGDPFPNEMTCSGFPRCIRSPLPDAPSR